MATIVTTAAVYATIAAATRRGSRLTVAWQLVMRSDASLRLGEIRRAEAEARSALELFEEGSGESAFAWGTAHLLNALVARGALEEADELAKRVVVIDHGKVIADASPEEIKDKVVGKKVTFKSIRTLGPADLDADVTMVSARNLIPDEPGEPKGRVTVLSKKWLLPDDEGKK